MCMYQCARTQRHEFWHDQGYEVTYHALWGEQMVVNRFSSEAMHGIAKSGNGRCVFDSGPRPMETQLTMTIGPTSNALSHDQL